MPCRKRSFVLRKSTVNPAASQERLAAFIFDRNSFLSPSPISANWAGIGKIASKPYSTAFSINASCPRFTPMAKGFRLILNKRFCTAEIPNVGDKNRPAVDAAVNLTKLRRDIVSIAEDKIKNQKNRRIASR